MSNHSFFAPSRSAFGALCQTSRSRQRAKSSRAAAVEPQLAPLCGRSLLVSFPLFTHCLSNTAPNSRIRVNESHIGWADHIFVMEKKHRRILEENFLEALVGKSIICLNIPDEYHYMEPA